MSRAHRTGSLELAAPGTLLLGAGRD
uniref:Uncharacterized protein n=1 Tax=Arundo donax TaxID=35708 RepID=A0A0A9HS39_ARUDO